MLLSVDNTMSDLTGLRFKPQTSRSRDERDTARPTNQYCSLLHLKWAEVYVAQFKEQTSNKLNIGSPRKARNSVVTIVDTWLEYNL